MKNEKLPKPSAADVQRLRDLEKKQKDGPLSDEYMELWNTFDWSPEVIKEEDKVGLKNAFGELILPVEFDDVMLLSSTMVEVEDRVVAMQNGKWGVVLADHKGTWLIPAEFDYIGYPNSITSVCKDGLWGVIDLAGGEFLIPPECEHVDDFNGFMFVNGIGSYQKGGLWGVITDYGAFTEPVFEDLDLEPDEWVKVKFKGEWGYIDKNNQFTTDEDKAFYTSDVD